MSRSATGNDAETHAGALNYPRPFVTPASPPVTSYSHFFLLNITSSTTMMTMHTTMMAW